MELQGAIKTFLHFSELEFITNYHDLTQIQIQTA